jgi:Ser/Thr protein kinase RdoA (MazF antagonist)
MQRILSQYAFGDKAVYMEPFGNGHINKTFLIKTSKDEKYILQQINTNVFKKPKEVMENISLVTSHIRKKVIAENGDPSRGALEIIPTVSGKAYAKIDEMYWRCYRFVGGAKTYEIIEKPELFYEVGKAIGIFQRQLSDFSIDKLHITIPDFHNTPVRFSHFLEISNEDQYNRGIEVFNEIKFVFDRQKTMSRIVRMLENGEIPTRVTHNDTKLNNVMLDEETNEAICVIDLDTVMPGSVLYDFGDAIRIGASTAVEDEKDLTNVHLDKNLFHLFTKGFLEKTYRFLNQNEVDNLVESARLITLECGMRFLTDYLNKDQYFSIKYPTHNLDRARTQFKLVEEIEQNYVDLTRIIQNIINGLKE